MKKINKNITEAATLPGTFYASETTFEKTIENVFAKSWQLITDNSSLKENNSAFPFNFMGDVLPEPLFFIKNNKGVQCFSNVCTHRGNILIDEPTLINKKIVCGYHGKSFDACGKFNFMPKSEGMKNFPCEQDDLPLIPSAQWRQFLFASLDPSFSLAELMKEVEERVGWMPIESFKYRADLSKDYLVDANWALYCDNFLEGFHIPFIHKDLNAILDYKNYDVETFRYSSLQIGYGKEGEDCFDLPNTSSEYGKNIAAYYFWLFPNLMLNFYPWGLSVNIITPLSSKQTKVEFKSYVWDESKLDLGAGADLHKVELEDEEIVQKVQKGVASRFYKHGRFSPSMEQGVHHFHLLISEFMGK
jgi:choline monooxygenase